MILLVMISYYSPIASANFLLILQYSIKRSGLISIKKNIFLSNHVRYC